MIHFTHRNQGEVYAVKTASTANGVTTTLLDQKGYEPRGRLIREWHSINGGTPVLISAASYDEMERMSSNALGNSIVTTAFSYDIQNRLRKINDPANLGTKPFAMELQYNSPDVTGATAQYAGNISASRWIQQGASGQTYYYNYDSYSRLTGGIHGGGNNEQYIGYDSNGNISALTRTGAQAAGLSYTYSGNRLTSLTKDGSPYSYAYDSNGNTTTDGLRGMTIAYNYLNLPKTVTKGSDVLTYIYDAAGGKLAEKLNSTVNNFYTGAVVYKGDKTIDYIQTPTGIVRKIGADFVRQYNISDHLGNTRSIVNQSGTVEQATDYYPYGLAFSYNNLDKNRYLYNGKELQNQTLATTFFGMYYYGARYYDPVIGRWSTVDPMAEKYSNMSPYVYCANNPIRFVDPDGKDIRLYNVTQNNDRGYPVAQPGLSAKTEAAMRDFVKTTEGRAFLAQFAKSGDIVGGYKFTKDGSLSNNTLNLWDYSYSNETGNITAQPSSGSYGVSVDKDGKATVTLKVVSYRTDKAEVEETLAHETQIHGYKVVDDIKGKATTSESQDHKALKNQDTNHQGYKQYKSVQEQLQKIDKDYNRAFHEAQREIYNKQY